MRSLTQQKGNENDPNNGVNQGQRNNGRRQPSASNISGKGRQTEMGELNELNKIQDTYGSGVQNGTSPRGED